MRVTLTSLVNIIFFLHFDHSDENIGHFSKLRQCSQRQNLAVKDGALGGLRGGDWIGISCPAHTGDKMPI